MGEVCLYNWMVGKIKHCFCIDQFNETSVPISELIHLYIALSSVTVIERTLSYSLATENTHLLNTLSLLK